MGIRRILLVEDDPDVREITTVILESNGFEVVPASSGEEAIELAQRDRIDAVLVDLTLPGMDGREVALRLQDYPVAILTGHDVDVVIPGASMVLQKPMAAEQLIKAVRVLLATTEDYEQSA